MRGSRRQLAACALTAVVLAGCSSSGKSGEGETTTSSSAPSTTTGLSVPATAPVDPDQVPNQIPYNVGERIGLPNDWLITVTRVHRPAAPSGLPSLPAGQQYVGVDLTMTNGGTETVSVNAQRIFTLTDASGHAHVVVAGPAGTGLSGSYAPGATHSGRLVFAAPVGGDLQMLLDGPAIHTQRAVFQIDPPTAPAQD